MQEETRTKLIKALKERYASPHFLRNSNYEMVGVKEIRYEYLSLYLCIKTPVYIFEFEDKHVVVDINGVIHELMKGWLYRKITYVDDFML